MPNSNKAPILYLDDEFPNLELFKLAFYQQYNVFTAQTVEDALFILSTEKISVLVTDFRMPEVSGLSFISEAKKEYPDLVCILLTAYSENELLMEAINKGELFAFKTKPWEIDDMLMVLRNATEKHQILLENRKLLSKLKETNQLLTQQNKTLKEREKEVKESRESYKILAESSFEGIVFMKDGKVEHFNPQIEEIFGYTKDDISNIEIKDLVHPDDFETVDSKIKSNFVGTYEFRGVKKSGEVINIEARTRMSKINNEPYRLSVIRDITEHKRIQNEYLENLNILDTIFNHSPIIMLVLNSKLEVVMINKTGLLLSQKAIEDVLGQKNGDIIGCINAINSTKGCGNTPECTKCKFFKAISDTSTKSIPYHKIEATYKSYDGNKAIKKTALVSTTVIHIKNENHVLVAIDDITKITHLKEELLTEKGKAEFNEKRYKQLADIAFEGIIIEKKGKIIDMNNSLLDMFCYDYNELIGTDFRRKFFDDKGADFFDLQMNNSGFNIFEMNAIRRDASVFPVEVESSFFTRDKEKIRVIAFRDLSERKRNEMKLRRAIIEAEEKQRNNFTQEMHDGVGPLLSTIKMFVQWAQRPENKGDFDSIAKNMEEAINEAIAQAKEISHNLSPGLLNRYGLEAALKSFIARLNVTGTRFKVNFKIKGRLDSTIEIVLYRSLVECINNIIKYAEAKNVLINIFCHDTMADVLVIDDGKGFDIDTEIETPSGYGIMNIENRIKTVSGTFEIESKLNLGTKIEIKIPLACKFIS